MMNTIKFIAFGLVLLFFGSWPTSSLCATLTGPEKVEVGELITIVCDEEGEWLITPVKGVTLAKDTGGKHLYFVASLEGDYTIIFFGVKDNKPVLTQKPVIVGQGDLPMPEPEPEPSPTVKILSDVEREAAIYAVGKVLEGIEDGSIKTPPGARSVFKQSLTQKGRVCNGTSCYMRPNLTLLADEWTAKADFSDIDSTKKSFQIFLKEVRP